MQRQKWIEGKMGGERERERSMIKRERERKGEMEKELRVRNERERVLRGLTGIRGSRWLPMVTGRGW